MWFTHDFIIDYLFKFNENKNNEIRLLLLTVLNIQTLDISSNVLVVIWGYTRNYRYNDFFCPLYKESAIPEYVIWGLPVPQILEGIHQIHLNDLKNLYNRVYGSKFI